MHEAPIQENEIDLLQLYTKITNKIKSFVLHFTLLFFMLIKKYYYIFLLAIFIGAGISVYKYKYSPNKSFLNVYFKSEIKNSNEVVKLFKNLEVYIRNKNYKQLTIETNLKEDILRKIIAININPEITNEELIKLSTNKKNENSNIIPEYIYSLSIEICGDFDHSKLYSGIKYYVCNNNYVKECFKIKNNSLDKQITKLRTELKQLDIYQKQALTARSTRSIGFINNKIILSNNVTYEDKIIEMSDKLIKLEAERQLNSPITFFSNFYKTEISPVLGSFSIVFKLLASSLLLIVMYESLKRLNKLSKVGIQKSYS